MVSTLLKAALPSIPVVNQLPGVRKTGGDPSLLHEVRTATVAREQVRAYAAVCGFPDKDTAPLTFPHVLAFPLHMAVMTSPQFPFPAIGTVHIANTVTSHRPVTVGETLQIEVHASALRPHPKGTAVDFVASASADGETVWESTSTYLRRGRTDAVVSTGSTDGGSGSTDAVVSTGSTDGGSGSTDPVVSTGSTDRGSGSTVAVVSTGSTDGGSGSTDAVVSTGSTDGGSGLTDGMTVVSGRITWRLAGDVGRRYAAVSGDHNPIHLYPLTAKALGFPRQIAHGMWSLARCVAALENRLPGAVTVEAEFKKPILLPGTVAFGQDRSGDGIAFALTSPKNGAPHVVGRTRPA
jgi:acyl dehydratase